MLTDQDDQRRKPTQPTAATPQIEESIAMKYQDYKTAALKCSSREAAYQLISKMEVDETITAREYYDLRCIAIDAAYLSEFSLSVAG